MDPDNKVCRICLHDGAIYPIFEKSGEKDIHTKILTCLQVDIEDLEGCPRQICNDCNQSLDNFINFMNTFKESSKILKDRLYVLKKENEPYENDFIKEEKVTNIKNEACALEENGGETQLKLTNVSVKRKLNKGNLNNRTSKIHVKNSTNKRASSVSEDDTWSGEDWCLKVGKVVESTKKPRKNLKKVLKANETKGPPLPKLCDLCGEVFKDQDKLSIHKRNFHFKNPVKCPKCPRFCASDYYLKRHIKRKHENDKNFVCTACGSRFAFKGEMTNHYKNVHNKASLPKKVFACKICNKNYKCHKSVIVHERSVHTGSRPAVCAICGSSFFHIDYLKEHMRLHTGETPFKCPICGRGYAQRCNMKSHLRIHKLSELDESMLSKLNPNYIKLLKA
ncbi:oocyte zinc finger protein XlCOF20-like [Battus philenor]|uniref:oocyte zinc finger protein XlCOF20-like n=1 Tax=Battus philenor TaxID=42288 RepID=UPI0035D044FE